MCYISIHEKFFPVRRPKIDRLDLAVEALDEHRRRRIVKMGHKNLSSLLSLSRRRKDTDLKDKLNALIALTSRCNGRPP
jgi:hypothetical protein